MALFDGIDFNTDMSGGFGKKKDVPSDKELNLLKIKEIEDCLDSMVDKIEKSVYHPDKYPNPGIDVHLGESDLLTLNCKRDDKKRFRKTTVLQRLSSCSSYLKLSKNPQEALFSLYGSGKVDLAAFNYLRRDLSRCGHTAPPMISTGKLRSCREWRKHQRKIRDLQGHTKRQKIKVMSQLEIEAKKRIELIEQETHSLSDVINDRSCHKSRDRHNRVMSALLLQASNVMKRQAEAVKAKTAAVKEQLEIASKRKEQSDRDKLRMQETEAMHIAEKKKRIEDHKDNNSLGKYMKIAKKEANELKEKEKQIKSKVSSHVTNAEDKVRRGESQSFEECNDALSRAIKSCDDALKLDPENKRALAIKRLAVEIMIRKVKQYLIENTVEVESATAGTVEVESARVKVESEPSKVESNDYNLTGGGKKKATLRDQEKLVSKNKSKSKPPKTNSQQLCSGPSPLDYMSEEHQIELAMKASEQDTHDQSSDNQSDLDQNSSSSTIGNVDDDDLLVDMSLTSAQQQLTVSLQQAFKNSKIIQHSYDNAQDNNQCSSIAVMTAAMHAAGHLDATSPTHQGIIPGKNVYSAVTESSGAFLNMSASLNLIKNDLVASNVVVDESFGGRNLFSSKDRRSLLDQLDRSSSRVGIALMFDNHALAVLNNLTDGGYILMDSLPSMSPLSNNGNKGFYWRCKDIETLEYALLHYALSRMRVPVDDSSPRFNQFNQQMLEFKYNHVDTINDSRAFDAYLFSCPTSDGISSAQEFEQSIEQSIQDIYAKRLDTIHQKKQSMNIINKMEILCQQSGKNVTISPSELKRCVGEDKADMIVSGGLKDYEIHQRSDVTSIQDDNCFIMTRDDIDNLDEVNTKLRSDIAKLRRRLPNSYSESESLMSDDQINGMIRETDIQPSRYASHVPNPLVSESSDGQSSSKDDSASSDHDDEYKDDALSDDEEYKDEEVKPTKKKMNVADIAKSTKESRAKAAQEKAELAKVNYDHILPEANACFEQNKFGETLSKYHKAMEDPLPDGTVSLEVLDRVFKCLKMLIDIDTDDESLIKQLECVERCLVLSKSEHNSRRSIEHHIMHIRILLKLLVSNQPKTNERFVLYHGLLCKSADHVCSASVDDSVKSSCMSWKANADQLLHTRAKSFKYKQTDKFLQSLEGINTPQKLITTAQQMMNDQHVHKGVQPILRTMIELEKSDTPKDEFKSEVDRLLVELANLLQKLTGKVINFGNGLRPEHLLFVLMNYATPTSTRWNEWIYDVMNKNESCIGFWRQSIITCLERGAGVAKSDDDKHDDSCISTTDRLFWRCSTNTSSYKNEIDPVCESAGITRDEMHLIPVIILALKVKYAKLCGHVPIILSTGSEARDNLFKATGTVITQHAIFAGCVPHSEMFQRKERFLAMYDIDEQQGFSQTLARFYASDYYTTSGCTVVEDWSGLGYLSKEEQEAFAEIQRRLKHEQSKRGGLTTGELGTLASALHDAGWDYENLSMEMKLLFGWCLEHKNRNLKEEEVFDDDEFIEFLTELRGSRVDGGNKAGEMATLASALHKVGGDYHELSPAAKLVFELHMTRKCIDKDEFIKFLTELRDSRVDGGQKGGKTTSEMAILSSKLHKVDDDYNKLSSEWKFIFELHMARKGIDEVDFIKFLTELRGSRVRGGKTTSEMAKLATALHDVDDDYNELSPEWKFIFELHMARKGIDEIDFIKFLSDLRKSRVKGLKTFGEMTKLATALHDVDDDYNELSPEWKFIFELHMARKGIDKDGLIKILGGILDVKSKAGKTAGEMRQLASKLHSAGGGNLSPEWQFIFDLHMARKKMDETSFKSYLQKLHGTNNFKAGKTDKEFNKQQSANAQAGWDKRTQKEIQDSNGWAITLSCPERCTFTRTKGLNAYNKTKEKEKKNKQTPQFRCPNCKGKFRGWTETEIFQIKVKDDSSKLTSLSEPTKKRGSKTSTDTSKKETKKKKISTDISQKEPTKKRGSKTSTDTSKKETKKKKKKISTDISQKKTITTTKRKKKTSTTKKSSPNIRNDPSTTTKKKKKMMTLKQQTINFKQTKVKSKRKITTADTSTQPTNAKKQKTDKKERWECTCLNENDLSLKRCSFCGEPRA